MDNKVMVLSKNELEENPTVIGESLVKLAQSLEDNKSDLSQIKERGFLKKLANNNTRDLAEAMIKQNETITGFLTIVQGVIFLSMNNVVVLGGIMDSLNKSEHKNELRDNKYFNMARDYLSEAILAAQKAVDNEKALKELKFLTDAQENLLEKQGNEISEIYKTLRQDSLTLEKMGETISELSGGIDKLAENHQEQNEKVEVLQIKDEENKLKFTKVNESLSNAENELHKQSINLTDLSKEIQGLKDKNEQLNTELDTVSSKFTKRLVYAYACGGIGIIVGIVSILL